MGKIGRIAKAVLQELNFGKVRTLEIPAPSSDKILEGKLALITGGSSGIGLEIARKFISSGCKVIIAGSSLERLEEANAKLQSGLVRYVVLDVTNNQSIEEAITKATELFPQARGIDILVNSAGVMTSRYFTDIDEATFDRIIDVNLKGTFFMCQAISRHMIERKIQGHILNISSSSALRTAKGPYEISKWGIKGMTLGLADVLIKDGIVVNALAPGPTATPMLGIENSDNIRLGTNPSGRYADPREIANLALVMVSTMGDLIVGDTLYATGGAGTICIDR